MQLLIRMLVPFGLLLATMIASAQPLVDGNAKSGKMKSTVCAACHAADGNSTIPQYPKLAGQHATYLFQQLKHFKSGKRDNAIMRIQAARLSVQDMKDLAVYFSQQTMQLAAADEDLVDRGAEIYHAGDVDNGVPACAGCHGPAGMGNAAAVFPRISGQHAQYIAQELKAYRAGERSGYSKAEIMTGVAQNLTNADIKAVASYLQGLRLNKELNE